MKNSYRIPFFVIVITLITVACGVTAPIQSSDPPRGAFVIETGSGAQIFLTNGSTVSQTIAQGTDGTGTDDVDIFASFPTTGNIKNHMVSAAAGTYSDAQAFMPESPAWIPTAMTGGTTIATSKMVLGVTSEELANLGLKPGEANFISFDTLIERVNDHSLNPMLCNPSQCDSGMLFYMSVLMHVSGQTILDLNLTGDSEVIAEVQTLMQNLTISTSSSASARQAMYTSLTTGGSYNAFWSYEPEIASLNTQLVSEGRSPLYVVYIDGAIDAALTLVMNPVYAKNDAVKAQFGNVTKFLSENRDVQTAIGNTGWRPSLYGVSVSADVLKPEWGFQDDPQISTRFSPRFDVAMPLLRTYVSVIRKPIILFYFDDDSGSMYNNGGRTELLEASQYLFSDAAATDFLEATEGDVTQVYLFDTTCVALPPVEGVNPEGYANLLNGLENSSLGGNTSMFACGVEGLHLMAERYRQACVIDKTHNCAFVFMTDGGDNQCRNSPLSCTSVDDFNRVKIELGLQDIPVWAVPFGSEVDSNQLRSLAGDNICYDTLIACFQTIKGSR